MDKLKYVKIENDDGTLSENIPIGVDAKNVDVNIAGGGSENLQTNLESKQTQIDSLKTQTQNNTTSIAANTSAINVEKSRIDNLAHLEEGSTTGDAELQDIRIGAFGRTYNNAGNAVRSILKAFFQDITQNILETKVEGKYIGFKKAFETHMGFSYYTLHTKKGKLYFISTLSSQDAPICAYYFNNTFNTFPKERGETYDFDVVVEGTGNDIYINCSNKYENFFVGEILSNTFENLYFNIIENTKQEGSYITFKGKIYENISYDLYSFKPKKGKIYLINGYSSENAPLIYQNKGQIIPNNLISNTEYNGQYLYFPNQETLDTVYINNFKRRGAPTVLESKFELTYPKDNFNNIIGITKNLVCIGDSLTAGETYISDSSPKFYNNYYSFPYFLSKLLQANKFENLGKGGATAQSCWNNIISSYEIPNNTLFTVWLGTNNAFTDTLETDCPEGTDYQTWSDTQTGCLGKILAKISSGSHNKIILLNNDSGASLETNNKIIPKFAERFKCLLVDVYNSNSKDENYHTAYNGYKNMVHFNAAGNNYIATLIATTLSNEIHKNPLFINFKEVATDLPYQS